MKKIIYIPIIIAGLFLNSCQHELDTFNENPNSPTQVTSPKTLFTGAAVGTINNSTGNLTRQISLLTQQTNGNLFQSLDYTNYFLTELDNETDWSNIYKTGVNLHQIITQFGDKYPYYSGMAKILLALNMGYATDTWGDVPFSEAFQGVNNFSPKYDSQQNVISQIQSYLDSAIIDLSKPENANLGLPAGDDIFYAGNIDKWKKLAYAIKARYALRLTQREGSTVAAQKALNYLQNSFTSSSDNLVARFDGGNNQNLWFAFNNQRSGYMSMGKYFIDLLKNSSDPRLPHYAGLDASGGYSGSAPEDSNTDASPFGSYFAGSASTSNIIFSYSEIKFIEAEAQFRLGNTVGAQAALKTAVSASLIDVTGTDNPVFATTASAAVTLQNIITQKYSSLFTTMEPYNDWRRTGFPVLTPNQNSQSKKIPLRLITPKAERTLNNNAAVVSDVSIPVWWDN
ncbi:MULTISPECIES: SusD/RagB family nutrient-binding outer membrane lipoprotein [Chryseobacterium]|uniref:SusD/RagB family nutrient-binding outer membrane lipoprotein n=1 Tax=Chryseobacterium TaxID=59732 RepID=UPI001C10D4B6|nr:MULTISPECIES: SusD/RagB family nutrient-binding outer membrane lipoprotein [Chryseobacterium]MDH5035562.1 SusD/RagB family nutrient-binding outer membrane lipoprotein [Chryseobacterium cucumeris]MDH5036245.1 SusD/RagB family nutrient-binding outer membrane lipoprotein [Chryseobacterium cucumeris]QWT85424.1 SusD/RagB family nutrient-binding outer membrane lipoprotein [Chryseobacterium sp. PCH239]